LVKKTPTTSREQGKTKQHTEEKERVKCWADKSRTRKKPELGGSHKKNGEMKEGQKSGVHRIKKKKKSKRFLPDGIVQANKGR